MCIFGKKTDLIGTNMGDGVRVSVKRLERQNPSVLPPADSPAHLSCFSISIYYQSRTHTIFLCEFTKPAHSVECYGVDTLFPAGSEIPSSCFILNLYEACILALGIFH